MLMVLISSINSFNMPNAFAAENKDFVALDLSPGKNIYGKYFNLKGITVDNQKGDGGTQFLNNAQLMVTCPNGRGSGISTTLQYNFAIPVDQGNKTIKISKDSETYDIKAYKVSAAASPAKLLLIIEQGSGNTMIAPTSYSEIPTAMSHVIKIQNNQDAMRHNGTANALFLDGHVAGLNRTDTNYTLSKDTLERWFTLK